MGPTKNGEENHPSGTFQELITIIYPFHSIVSCEMGNGQRDLWVVSTLLRLANYFGGPPIVFG